MPGIKSLSQAYYSKCRLQFDRTIEMKTKSTMKAKTSDMMIWWSERRMMRSAWQFAASAYVTAVSRQADRNIPPSERRILVSEVWAFSIY